MGIIVITCVVLFVALNLYLTFCRKWSPLEGVVATGCVAMAIATSALVGSGMVDRRAEASAPEVEKTIRS